jgi:hypothetical protein
MMPNPSRIRALVGIWELDGEMVRLLEDPKTGALVAVTCQAEWVNPMRVVSRGTRMM